MLLDFDLASANDFFALVSMRAQHPGVPVALMCVDAQPSLTHRALTLGISGPIPKCVQITMLGSLLKRVLARDLVCAQC